MKTVHTIAALREQVAQWRRDGQRIAFVPTMGNLHAGHLKLIDEARQRAQCVVASIFVNPMQFGENEDYGDYPRTLSADADKLANHQADLLFAPPVEEIYNRGSADATRVEVPGISDILCGSARPGHFVGVASVVCKLLNIVQPHVAFFGAKDYQQVLVIRRMVEDLSIPVEIVAIETVREADGLAMSSRNQYLSEEARRQAPALYRTLCQVKEQLLRGNSGESKEWRVLESAAVATLESAGFQPVDYFVIRRSENLAEPCSTDRQLQIVAAGQLDGARLIDNVAVNLDGATE
ncbi:MAG: pantoate--beta-alanine ligase [Gammaproteobacteria bacterium]|nr:pantoate--beta-alanine ligase [Gammaproteobacteria bacterium]